MVTTDFLPQVEKLYKAYYGRAADQDGAAFWSAKLTELGGDVTKIVSDFAHSDEATHLYGGMDDAAKVNKIYQQTFSRDADSDGLHYWVSKLQSGEITPDSIMLSVVNGAQGNDLNKIESDVADAIGRLDRVHVDALVEQYRVTSTAAEASRSQNGSPAIDISHDHAAQVTDHFPTSPVEGFDAHGGIELVGMVSDASVLHG